MSKAEHSKNMSKIYGSVKVYNHHDADWHYLKPLEVGDIKHSMQSDDHNGWMICNGRSLSRADYPELFAVIGTSFGSNDSSTFNLPDARGRVIGTIGTGSGLSSRTLGQAVGSESHTLTVNELPAHSHTYTRQNGVQTIAAASGGATTAADEPTVTDNTSSVGGGQSFSVMQPTLFMGNVFVFSHHKY